MQVSRQERIAKAQGIAIIVLMAAVAVTVHFWPRPPSPQRVRSGNVPLSSAPAIHERATPPPARRPHLQRRQATAELTVPRPRPAQPDGHAGIAVALVAMPGSQIDLPPAQPPAPRRDAGAVTRGAQSTGKALARAFQKTGAAFRRAF